MHRESLISFALQKKCRANFECHRILDVSSTGKGIL